MRQSSRRLQDWLTMKDPAREAHNQRLVI